MTPLSSPMVYDELVDVLAEEADANCLLAFRLSDDKQRQLDDLLAKNRAGSLTSDESSELEGFAHFEHVVRLLKARLLQARRP